MNDGFPFESSSRLSGLFGYATRLCVLHVGGEGLAARGERADWSSGEVWVCESPGVEFVLG